MAYVHVEVDLDEFDTDELVDEIVQRLRAYGKKQLNKKQKDDLKSQLEDLPHQTLEDKMKVDFVLSIWNKYTSWQLEEKLK